MRLKKLNNKQVISRTIVDRKEKNKPRQDVAVHRLRDNKGRLVSKKVIEEKVEDIKVNFSRFAGLLIQLKKDVYQLPA